MRSRTVSVLALACMLVACRGSGHPEGEAMLPRSSAKPVVTVDGQPIDADEAAEFAATHDDATLDALVEREVRARRALKEKVDVEFARKQAMVDAFVVDEIEGKISEADVDPAFIDKFRPRAEQDLTAPGGYEVIAVRVFAVELLQGRPSPERRQELLTKVMDTAARLHNAVPETDGLEAVNSLDVTDIDPAITVRVFDLRIVDAEVTKPTKGWSRAPRLAAALAEVPDGGRTPVFVTQESPVFAVRKSRVPPRDADAEAIDREARRQALNQVRTERMNELLSSLREDAAVVTHMDVFEEQM